MKRTVHVTLYLEGDEKFTFEDQGGGGESEAERVSFNPAAIIPGVGVLVQGYAIVAPRATLAGRGAYIDVYHLPQIIQDAVNAEIEAVK